VLPFLLGDTLVARVDLKSDRKSGVLRVPGAFVEPGHEPQLIARELAIELLAVARWLGLDNVWAASRGSFAKQLGAELTAAPRSW
jgi:uncharacterized protein